MTPPINNCPAMRSPSVLTISRALAPPSLQTGNRSRFEPSNHIIGQHRIQQNALSWNRTVAFLWFVREPTELGPEVLRFPPLHVQMQQSTWPLGQRRPWRDVCVAVVVFGDVEILSSGWYSVVPHGAIALPTPRLEMMRRLDNSRRHPRHPRRCH